jgi:hypothetical protein
VAWTAEVFGNPDWVHITPGEESGNGDGDIEITIDANPTVNARTATITVTPDDNGLAAVLTQTVTISQLGGPATLGVEATDFDTNVDCEGGDNYTVTVTSNTAWTAAVSGSPSWVTITGASGNGNAAFTVRVAQTSSTDTREATIIITASGAPNKTVTVTQKGGTAGEIKSVKTGWTATATVDENNWYGNQDNGGVEGIIDGDYGINKFWHANGFGGSLPVTIIIDMKTPRTVTKTKTLRRMASEALGGDTKALEFYVGDSADGPWTELVKGEYPFRYDDNNPWDPAKHTLELPAPTPQTGQFLKVDVTEAYRNPPAVSIHEIDVFEQVVTCP